MRRRVLPLAFAAGLATAASAPAELLKLESGGIMRSYTLVVPTEAGAKRPLVLMLHGAGGSGVLVGLQTGWTAKAEAEGFIAAYPDAMPVDPGQPASFRGNPRVWNEGRPRNRWRADDVAFLQALLDDVVQRAPVDTSRIYLVGHSNGASMALTLASIVPERFAAVAVIAGDLWQDPEALPKPLPLLQLVGDSDPMHPIAGGWAQLPWGTALLRPPPRQVSERWATLLGCPPDPQRSEGSIFESDIWSPCRGGSEVRFTVIHGHGHEWPGGRPTMPETIAGPRLEGIDATDMIWRFLAARRLP
jgi:polyhydroxybutyrate depolymerase